MDAPNKGQIALYPTFANAYASISVNAVATYLLVNAFLIGDKFSSDSSLSKNNSWNERRPILATESKLVKAKADTAKLINVKTTLCGKPIVDKKFAIAPANFCAGVAYPAASAAPELG